MKRFYSPSTQNTYLVGINTAVMPADAVEISEARYLEVIANPPLGKVRSHEASGLPVLIDPPQPSAAEMAKSFYARQFSAINSACESAITAGFTSEALGASYYYTSQIDDQLNLTGMIQVGLDSLYACRDLAGTKEFRPHTAEQLRRVGNDFTTVKLQFLQKANSLKQQLDQALAAGDLPALEAVTWDRSQ